MKYYILYIWKHICNYWHSGNYSISYPPSIYKIRGGEHSPPLPSPLVTDVHDIEMGFSHIFPLE